ncbi:hypothetical protein SUSUWATARI_00190 [Serratia phage vB_SmaM-Susuwatari]|nr:hypothetical protein SUSUWATARI_00190 [Serratia phage vB_SmaM-Susuwatari]
MANMGNMVIIDAARVRAIREYVGEYLATADKRPSNSELMALLSELIERRAQDGDWPESLYVTIPQGDVFSSQAVTGMSEERQTLLAEIGRLRGVIDDISGQLYDTNKDRDEWRKRCYRNEEADADAVRQSMQQEINKRDEAISRKDTLIAQMAVDDDAARTNSIAAHRRIAELQSRLAADNDQLEQSQGIIARRNTSIDALAKEADEAKKQIDELTAKSERKTKYIGTLKAKHAELALQLRLDLDNMTESNRGHVIALKRAKAKLAGLAPLVESEISDFFAGIGSPGEPETPEVMQAQLSARILNAIAGD